MHPNEQLLARFYESFAARDAAPMADSYAEDARFSDPVFPNLKGPDIGAMWAMLCAQGKDLSVEHSNVEADDRKGSVHWDARYSFSMTGRKVYNRIDAEFVFREGKIVEHTDSFNLWAWTRMALGPTGVILGWTPMVQNKIRNTAAKSLARFKNTQPSE